MKPREMLKDKLIEPSDLTSFREKTRKHKKTIAFTAGGWDMLHIGQMRFLEEARKMADILVVGVENDETIQAQKGKDQPILDLWIRAESLAFMRCVDYVTMISIPSYQPTLELLKPDVFVNVNEEYNKYINNSKEYVSVIGNSGRLAMIDRQSPFVSSATIVERIVGAHLGEVFAKYVDRQEEPIKEKFQKTIPKF